MTVETTSLPVAPPLAKSSEPSSLTKDAIRHLLQKKSAVIGMIILLLLTSVALLAPIIAPFNPETQLIGVEEGLKKRSPPCIHALG
jgi:ABC-type antimicrobial peptide transport system permease subunit